MTTNRYEGLTTPEHAVAAFAGMEPKPYVIIGHDINVPADAAFATEVATYLRDRKVKAMSLSEYQDQHIPAGLNTDEELLYWSAELTHLINVVSTKSKADKGINRSIRGRALLRNLELEPDKGQTRVFELTSKSEDIKKLKRKVGVENMHSWDNDDAKKAMIIDMIANGPGGWGK